MHFSLPFTGAKFSAYFYLDMMIANLLYIIPMATSQSLFAEGSYRERELKVQLKKAIKIISLILIPIIIVTFLFGNYILLAFGKKYSDGGFILLIFLTISGAFISINAIGGAIINIKHKIILLILLRLITAAVIVSLIIILIKINLFGLVGVGIGWIVGQVTLIKRLLL